MQSREERLGASMQHWQHLTLLTVMAQGGGQWGLQTQYVLETQLSTAGGLGVHWDPATTT